MVQGAISITPSKAAVQKFRTKVRAIWLACRGQSVRVVLAALNPVIRGWTNYYRTVVSKATFRVLDNWMFQRCVRYAKHTHPLKPWKWMKDRYWGQLKSGSDNRWVFGDKRTGAYLLQLSWTPIVRHVLVQGQASPDDPALRNYWDDRRKKLILGLPPRWIGLARTQKGLCPTCKASLFNGEELHVHHVLGRGKPDSNKPENLRLLHLFCHQQEHSDRKATPADMEALQLA